MQVEMQVQVVEHPLVAERLTRLRETVTSRSEFRAALAELTSMLVYEATRHRRSVTVDIDTPLGPAVGVRLLDVPIIVPVMRAGLGMLEATLKLLAGARTGFVGLARDEQTLLPHAYANTLPDDLEGRDVMVLDPMLATGGSCVHTCSLLRELTAGRIDVVGVLAAPEGVERVRLSGAADAMYLAAIDDALDENGFILPGLGDAGDRQFGLA